MRKRVTPLRINYSDMRRVPREEEEEEAVLLVYHLYCCVTLLSWTSSLYEVLKVLIDWLISPVLKLNAVVATCLQIFLRRSSASCAPDISFFYSFDFCVYLCPSFFFLRIKMDTHLVHQAVGYVGDRIVSVHVQLTFCIDNRFWLFVACWKVISCCKGGNVSRWLKSRHAQWGWSHSNQDDAIGMSVFMDTVQNKN